MRAVLQIKLVVSGDWIRRVSSRGMLRTTPRFPTCTAGLFPEELGNTKRRQCGFVWVVYVFSVWCWSLILPGGWEGVFVS